jgi:hypothetical protein
MKRNADTVREVIESLGVKRLKLLGGTKKVAQYADDTHDLR